MKQQKQPILPRVLPVAIYLAAKSPCRIRAHSWISVLVFWAVGRSLKFLWYRLKTFRLLRTNILFFDSEWADFFRRIQCVSPCIIFTISASGGSPLSGLCQTRNPRNPKVLLFLFPLHLRFLFIFVKQGAKYRSFPLVYLPSLFHFIPATYVASGRCAMIRCSCQTVRMKRCLKF